MRRLTTIFFVSCLYVFVMTPANAVTLAYNYSFTNIANGGGTVEGTIFGLTDDATSAATRLIVTSNTLGFGVGEYVGFASNNSFTVSGSVITAINFLSFGVLNSAPDVICCSLSFTTIPSLGLVAGLTNEPGSAKRAFGTGLSFSLIPLPAALPMFLLALAGLGFAARKRRQA